MCCNYVVLVLIIYDFMNLFHKINSTFELLLYRLLNLNYLKLPVGVVLTFN